jgi:integrase
LKINFQFRKRASLNIVGEWIPFWLDTYKRPVIKASTLERHYKSFDLYIKPYFGKMKCSAVTSDMVQIFYNDMFSRGLSESSIKKVHFVLRPALERAMRKGFIKRNPCDDVVIPKTMKRKASALTAIEQGAFENALPNTVYGDLIKFALYTGLRVGEVSALNWSDVDLPARILSVNKTMYRVKGRTLITTPKTATSVRTVTMGDTAVDIIYRRFENRGNGNIIFSSANGTLLNYHNIRRVYKSVLNKVGLPINFTIHSTRHTYATRLIERGADVKTVSELLGHATVKFTLDIYNHVTQKAKHEAVALLENKHQKE